MAHSAKSLQKALSHFRFTSPINERNKQHMFTHLVDRIAARVAQDPLTALNELNETYNAIISKKVSLKVDKNPSVAILQENIVLHALQTLYKQKIDRYLLEINTKPDNEKKAAVEELQRNHRKIINQKTNPSAPVNISQTILTLLQATSPSVSLPKGSSHAPLKNVQWQDDTAKKNIIKSFAEEYTASRKKREKLIRAIKAKNSNYPEADAFGIETLDSKLNGLKQKITQLRADPDETVREGAKKAMIDAGLIGQVHNKFLHQLLSGFKNPETLKENEAASYDEEEITRYAHSLLTVMKPSEIFVDIAQFYQQTSSVTNKERLIVNAIILLHELIIVDNARELFPDFSEPGDTNDEAVAAFKALVELIKQDGKNNDDLKELGAAFEKTIQQASKLAHDLQQKDQQHMRSLLAPAKENVQLDVQLFIDEALSNPDTTDKQISDAAKIVATDFKKIAIAHLVNIKATDLYRQAWIKPGKKEKTHVRDFMQSSDKISHVVSTDLVNAQSTPHQKQIALFYCRVLEEAIRTHDYHTAYAIFGGFEVTATKRLTHLLEVPEIARTLENAQKLLEPTDPEFAKLRELLAKNKENIVVPHIGMFGKDLTFADSGSEDRTQNDINYKKLNILNKIYLDLNRIIKKAKQQKPTGQSSSILEKITQFTVDEKAEFERSQSFRARPIATSGDITLTELLAKFPEQKVPLFLEIRLKTKDKERILTNKKAYKAILKLIIDKAHDANMVERAAANQLVNNILKAAQMNDLDTTKVKKLGRAAQLITAMEAQTVITLDFVKKAADQYYNVQVLKAELEGSGYTENAKHLANKADEIRDDLSTATRNPSPDIAALAKKALALVDLMKNIPLWSEKYKSLKVALANIEQGPNRLKLLVATQDQMEKIEDQLRQAAKHADPRINIPAQLALNDNQIGPNAVPKFDKAIKRAGKQEDKAPAMLMSQHRSAPVENAPAQRRAASQEPIVLKNFISDVLKAKTVLEHFHNIPKYKNEDDFFSLQLILKQQKEANPNHTEVFSIPDFNISFSDYAKFFAIATLDYVAKSLHNNSSAESIDQLINETSTRWPEGQILLTHLKDELNAESRMRLRKP